MNRIALFLLAIAVFAYVASAASSTSVVIYSDKPKSPPAFLSGTFNISWPTEASICALQDLGSGSASWIIGSTAPTTDAAYRSVGCGIFTGNNNVNLTGFSDLEFYARLAVVDNAEQPVHQLTYINVMIELQDADGNKANMVLKITDQLTRFILPLDNFPGINKAQIHGVMLITILEITNYQHVRYLAIDSARFNSRTAYKVFADAITISREAPSGPSILYNWVEDGANTTGCDPNYAISYAPEGVKVMNIPKGTWGCGLNNIPLNLNRAVSLKFNLKSKTGVKVEIMDFQGNKAGVSLNTTKGIWQSVTIPVTQLTGVDMTQLSWPFMITREADNTDAVLWFDNVRYSFI